MTCPPNAKLFLKTKHRFARPLCFRKNLQIYLFHQKDKNKKLKTLVHF